MDNPKPINLATSEQIRARGWAAEARDDDGHLISVLAHLPLASEKSWIRWIDQCTRKKLTITFFANREKDQ